MGQSLHIRAASREDVPLILQFVRELAEYEKAPNDVVATEELLRQSLFGSDPAAECALAFWDDEPAGFAVYFYNYSTWTGRRSLYLEDLFVQEHLRGKGIGKDLLRHLAAIAISKGCARMEWSVLDWNTPAIEFYKSLGAVAMDGWTVYRLDERAMERFARPAQ